MLEHMPPEIPKPRSMQDTPEGGGIGPDVGQGRTTREVADVHQADVGQGRATHGPNYFVTPSPATARIDGGTGISFEGPLNPEYPEDPYPTTRAFTVDSAVAALDMHLSHWSWMGTSEHRRATLLFLRSFFGQAAMPPPDVEQEIARQWVREEIDVVYDAVTHYVSTDVADVVEQMSRTMPPDILQFEDVPLTNGYMVLGKTWEYLNFHVNEYVGKIPIRAIAWTIAPVAKRLQRDGGEWIDHDESWGWVESNDQKKALEWRQGVFLRFYADKDWFKYTQGDQPDFQYGAPLIMVDMWSWTFDNWWEDLDDPNEEPDSHHAAPHVGEMRRKLLALWRFMNEEIVRTERVKMPRPTMRRWGRSKKEIPKDGSIVTIHLRRIRTEHDGRVVDVTHREWSHRWWVRGHHRFNPKTGRKDIWVRPYLKGPDDLPIVVKEKLVVVER